MRRPPPRPRRRLVRVVGAAAEVGLLMVVASGLVAQAVHPRVAWWPQIAALGVVPAAVLTGALGAWWTKSAMKSPSPSVGRWAVAAIHLSLAAGVALRAEGEPWTDPGAEPSLTVLSLNVGGAGRDSPARLGALLDASTPALVVLQEGPVVAEPDPRDPGAWVVATRAGASALVKRPAYRVVLPAVRERTTIESPVFGRLPLRSRAEGRLGDDERAGQYSRTELIWNGQPVAVYNVHLRSVARPTLSPSSSWWHPSSWAYAERSLRDDLVRRADEADDLRRLLADEGLPYLIMGDFNSTPNQWAYHRIAEGHRDVLRHPRLSLRFTFPDAFPVLRIDGILASQHWTVRSGSIGPGGMSDHRPLLADLVLLPDSARVSP